MADDIVERLRRWNDDSSPNLLPEKLRTLAEWFDLKDDESGQPLRTIQRDLRGAGVEIERLTTENQELRKSLSAKSRKVETLHTVLRRMATDPAARLKHQDDTHVVVLMPVNVFKAMRAKEVSDG